MTRSGGLLIVAAALAVSSFAAAAPPARPLALDPALRMSQYSRRSWGSPQGLPVNSVSALAQTHDGALWAGTEEGLVRFNGREFTRFDSTSVAELAPGQNIKALLATRDGALWIGTQNGLLRERANRFQRFTSGTGLDEHVLSLFEASDGAVWIGTTTGISRYRDGRFTHFGASAGLAHGHVWSITETTGGTIWAGTSDGLFRSLTDGRWEAVESGNPLFHAPVRALAGDGSGIWIGIKGAGLVHLDGETLTHYGKAEGLSDDMVVALLQSSNGTLWIGTNGGGLNRLANGRIDTLRAADGLGSDLAWALLEDRDGSLWVGMMGGGLQQLYSGKFVTWGTPEGVSSNIALAVREDRSGTMWIGTAGGGLNALHDGAIRHYSKRDGLPSNVILSLAEDASGDLWIGTTGGLVHRHGKSTRVYTHRDGLPTDPVTAILPTRDGKLWVGTNSGGLSRLDGEHFVAYTVQDGLAGESVTSLLEDHAGRIWIGTDDGGVSVYDGGHFLNYTTHNGLATDQTKVVFEDSRNDVWVIGSGPAIAKIHGTTVRTYSRKEGLCDGAGLGILEDAQKRLWIASNSGICRVALSEFDALDAGKGRQLHVTHFDTVDGMRDKECNGGFSPSAWKSHDGRLWFPTAAGVATIDPLHYPVDTTPPHVSIDSLRINGKEFRQHDIPPGVDDVEIRFSALSLAAPDAIRVRYRLRGVDDRWIDAGERRAAYFTNLLSGDYTFELKAANADGIEAGAVERRQFHVAPHFYQTVWFYLLSAMLIVATVETAYRLRVGVHKERERLLQKEVQRRTSELSQAVAHLEREIVERERAEAELQSERDQLRLATEELTMLNQELEAFGYSVSHDLRAPLRAVRGFTEQLSSRLGDGVDATSADYLRRVVAATAKMSTLIEALLELSRVARADLDTKPLDLGDEAEQIIAELHRQEPGRSVRFTLKGALRVTGDERLMRIVLDNLLRNAWKFTAKREQAYIELTGEPGEAGKMTTITLRDNGAGFDMEQAGRLFSPFQRLHSTGDFEGTGIGLATVQRALRRQGGSIRAEGRDGIGATFIFTLPGMTPAEAPTCAPEGMTP